MPRKRVPKPKPNPKYPDRDSQISTFIRDRRHDEAITQRMLAQLAGVAPRVVWELEHGKRTMRMDAVNAVLHVFGKMLGVVDAPRAQVDE